ncbi:ATP-dependent DNA helicase RecQ-like [Haliotis cracherodii]|uniref:ATP-dependent DNA helicase RecQ-like n=1 Tax=Haliotis cracherodii TaxID=6455 RepID=UPI0039EB36C6
MFHSKTNREVKKYVSQSFIDPNGFKRIVLCSTSFSMGLDLQSLETVIHYGPANNVEDYIQETGRAGRDPEKQAHALLMQFRQCLSDRRNISDEMKQYVRTNVCRRVELLKSFDQNPQQIQPLHKCCDNCAISCKCLCDCIGSCTCNTPCSECRCDILVLYKTSLDSSDSSSSHSDSEHEDHETSSDSDIATGSRFSHVTLNYTSEED